MLGSVLSVVLLQGVSSQEPVRAVAPVRVPEAAVAVDGALAEDAWSQAAVLRGFSQYLPVDGRPADDSTTVLVFYSPTAIYFGIRAFQDPASVRATLADRDRIEGDDLVAILLDTFDDQRRAFLFAMNPLGVQADGTLEDAARRSASYQSSAATGAYTIDLNPDFVYESRGRLTATGYEIEVRIPFKSLRYQAEETQDWGINVIRRVRATGHESTWTPVLQAHASFLAHGGRLTGLTGIRRGLVLDVTPEMTSGVDGGPGVGGWTYGGGRPAVGANVRWGITNNLSLNGTANPDFSQVEADVAQLQFDPRQSLYFPEKRPFFLDGLELFRSPVQLIYSRRLVEPLFAAKLTGKVSATDVAFLSGVDDTTQSATGAVHPVLNMLRARRDLGGQNTLGVVYTDKVDGSRFNRVGAVDGRLVMADRYALTFQAGGSATRTTGETVWAPFWLANVNRAGRTFGFRAFAQGFHEDFRASGGFLSRTGIVYAGLSPSYTIHGAPGSALESFTGNILVDGFWDYGRFFEGHIPNDPRLHINAGFQFRGGWQAGTSVLIESFMYPAELYTGYAIERTVGGVTDTIPFTGTNRLYNFDVGVNVGTPRFQTFSANAFVIVGRDDNFFEWAPGNIVIGTLDVTWRPSEQLRVNVLYNHQQYIRPRDGSTVGVRRVPRLKVEYQLTRSVFVRFVGQYDAERRDALRDDSRTDAPILVLDAASGVYVRTEPWSRNNFRVDWLFSYRPTPGTVVFLGYGSSLEEPSAFRFGGLERRADGFFAKLSYRFRV